MNLIIFLMQNMFNKINNLFRKKIRIISQKQGCFTFLEFTFYSVSICNLNMASPLAVLQICLRK